METRALLKLLTHKRDQIRDKLFSTFLHFILQKNWTVHGQDALFLVAYVVQQMSVENHVAYYHIDRYELIIILLVYIHHIIYVLDLKVISSTTALL